MLEDRGANVQVGVVEQRDQGAAGVAVAHPLQPAQADLAHERIAVGEELEEERAIILRRAGEQFLGGGVAGLRIIGGEALQAGGPAQRQGIGGDQAVAQREQALARGVGDNRLL